jgi:hypothetical protein
MASMLLINPAKRGKRRATAKRRKNPSAKQRANWRRFAAAARARRNPVGGKRRAHKRRRNPIGRSVTRSYRRITRRRRSNPIGGSLLNFRSYIGTVKEAALQGVGAVAMDVGYSYVNRMLPASLQRTPGVLGVGDAIKAFVTVALGRLLSGATRGLSNKAALGSLTVQTYQIASGFLPASMPVAGLGYVTAGRVVPGNGRVSANQRAQVGQYTSATSPLLSGRGGIGQYTSAITPLLSRSPVRR